MSIFLKKTRGKNVQENSALDDMGKSLACFASLIACSFVCLFVRLFVCLLVCVFCCRAAGLVLLLPLVIQVPVTGLPMVARVLPCAVVSCLVFVSSCGGVVISSRVVWSCRVLVSCRLVSSRVVPSRLLL